MADATVESNLEGKATGDPAPANPSTKPRSIWRVSLGGAMLFAAGAMVGFAPMRAWLFFRDDPRTVTISAVVVEADAKDAASIRQALRTQATKLGPEKVDPRALFESRPGTKTIAEPTLKTRVGESVTFFSGGEIFRAGGGTSRFGFETTFEPEVRPSGQIELSYRISHRPKVTAIVNDGGPGSLVEIDESWIESRIVVRPGEWQAVEWSGLKSPSADRDRVRWVFLKVDAED